MRPCLAALALAVLLVGCSSSAKDAADGASSSGSPTIRVGQSDPLAEFPKCSDWLTRQVSADEAKNGCVAEGTLHLTVIFNCPGSPRPYFITDKGWGFFGQPMTAHTGDSAKVTHCGS